VSTWPRTCSRSGSTLTPLADRSTVMSDIVLPPPPRHLFAKVTTGCCRGRKHIRPQRMTTTSHGCGPLAGRRSTALIQRGRPLAPGARPHHLRRLRAALRPFGSVGTPARLVAARRARTPRNGQSILANRSQAEAIASCMASSCRCRRRVSPGGSPGGAAEAVCGSCYGTYVLTLLLPDRLLTHRPPPPALVSN
jgi:hypothetical protein